MENRKLLCYLLYFFSFFNGSLMFYPNIKQVIGIALISYAVSLLGIYLLVIEPQEKNKK